MNKSIMISAAIIFSLSLANSCKKTGGSINPLSSVSNNGVGAYLVLDSALNLDLNSASISASTLAVQVHYYPAGEKVDHIILFASPSTSFDTTQWHMIKSVPYTSPKTTLSVTGAELGVALGIDTSAFPPGSSYVIFTRAVTVSGKTYDVTNTGDNSGSGLISGLAYNSAFFFIANVICPFEPPMAGDYNIITDAWQDYSPLPQLIPGAVTDGPGVNQISLHVYPGPAAGIQTGPMIVDVNPVTGSATIEKSTIGTYGGSVTTVTGSGNVFSCTGTISLNVDFVLGGADQGSYLMVIVKN